jgi:hypothetical protein
MRQTLSDNANPVLVYEFGESKALAFNAGGALRTTIPDSGEKGPEVLRLTATAPMYFALGSETVDATNQDVMMVTFDPILVRVRGSSHLSALGVIGGGTLNIAEVL